MHQLKQAGKVIFESAKKIDVIFEHQKYARYERVTYVKV